MSTKRKQTKKESFIEAITNTFIGFIVSYITLLFLNYFYNMGLSLFQNLQVVIIFTFISIIRNYIIRRYFNKKGE